MKYVKGDLLQLAKWGNFDIIVHGCNCFHTMGGGIALQIKNQFPGAYKADCESKYGDKSKLGTWTTYYDPEYKFYIFNAYTQYSFGMVNKPQVDYRAIEKVFRTIGTIKTARVGYPAIGAGLAGGNWGIISHIINTELKGMDHTFVDFTGQFEDSSREM